MENSSTWIPSSGSLSFSLLSLSAFSLVFTARVSVFPVPEHGAGKNILNYALANIQTLLSPFDWDIILLEYALNDDVGDGSLLVSSRRERFSIEYEG